MDDFQAKVDAGVSPMEKEFPIIGRQRSVIFHLALASWFQQNDGFVRKWKFVCLCPLKLYSPSCQNLAQCRGRHQAHPQSGQNL